MLFRSMEAAKVVKEEGGENDLLDRIAADPSFGLERAEIDSVMKPENFIGLSPIQVDAFLDGIIRPMLKRNKEILGEKALISV